MHQGWELGPPGRQNRWEYAEVRLYRRVTVVLFTHDQAATLVEDWSRRETGPVDPKRSNARYLQLNRQVEPIEVLAGLGDDGWELVASTSAQSGWRYLLKRQRG